MRRKIINALDDACSVVDRWPMWTWPIRDRLGCPHGLAYWGYKLEERWSIKDSQPMAAAERAILLWLDAVDVRRR